MPSTANLPVLFVADLVVLPGMVVPIELDEPSQAAIDAARSSSEGRLLVAPRFSGPEDRYPTYGVVATVERVGRFSGGGAAAVLKAEQRGRIGNGVTGPGAALWVEVETVDEVVTDRARELAEDYKHLVVAVLQRREAWQLIDSVHQMTDPSAIADAAGYAPYLSVERKRELLETTDVEKRLETVIGWTREHLAEVDVADKIGEDVREGMEKSQREFLLRQQLNAIRKELGEGQPEGSDDYRARVEAAEVPDAVREALLREVGKLERSSDQSPETAWIRTWLDTVLELPWSVTTADIDDVKAAREVLDADHHGLDEVKERIVEYLAVRARRAQRGLQVIGGRGSGAVILLAGPPGVGKTSLGESVARALGRRFVRVALGGVRDEAEIRGHRRTYVGSQPGRIARALSEAGTMNPVILLDEVDKLMPGGWSGDPTSALLEVLDPAQNHTFRDHYLEIDLDLSQVVFIATANVADTIPGPLLDRMDLVRLDGYTDDEKVFIARNHLLPRLYERTALRSDEVVITDDAIGTVIEGYTREAGVRTLERELGRLLRKAATRIAVGDDGGVVDIGAGDVATHLGRKKVHLDVAERTAVPGVATGLAVTGAGGDVLFIEASSSPGEPALVLTGQLGDVMKESAQIALSYVRANQARLGLDGSGLDRRFHVHVPAGAVPKDGPSAGVTLTTALVSLLSGRPVKPSVGMTGEVTLQGKVLPIGGVKQKVMAAHRAGLTDVVLPRRNEVDVDDVPERVRQAVTIHFADTIDDVLAVALS
jgi:ATP-dependent Lon protease